MALKESDVNVIRGLVHDAIKANNEAIMKEVSAGFEQLHKDIVALCGGKTKKEKQEKGQPSKDGAGGK